MRGIPTLFFCLLIAVAPGGVAQAGSTAGGERTFSEAVSDAMLATAVKTSLLTDLGFDALGIDVEVRAGQVTLAGTVSKRATAEQSKSVALAVDGVGHVHNQVIVEAPQSETPVGDAVAKGEREVKDALLEGRVKTALLTELGKSAFDIEVEATDGIVSLRGEVDGSERERIALDVARDCEGVARVIDLLES